MNRRWSSLLATALGTIEAWVLVVLSSTWRVRTDGLDEFDARLARGERILAAFWHGSYVPLFVLLAGRRACIFSSRSFRGAVIAAICRRFGYACEMLEDRGGTDSFDRMLDMASSHQLVGLAVDGPLGPRHLVKRGVARLASDLGFAIVPFGVAIGRARVYRERWDRLALPLPFSRIHIIIGAPLVVRANLDPGEIDPWCGCIGSRLEQVTRQAERSCANAPERITLRPW